MRNREYRRGTPAYRLAKAQGRLPSQIAAKKAAKKKAAPETLPRKTDLSATRKIEGPKTKRLSPPTAKQAGNKLIQTGQATVKKAKFNQLSPYQQSVQTRNESRANSKRDKLNDSISRAKAKMGPQNTDYKNNYIQSEIDKLKKQLAKIK